MRALKIIEVIEDKTEEVSATWRESGRNDPFFTYGRDPYHEYSGESGRSSFRSIGRSRPQLKLVVVALAWYAFQAAIYSVLANYLVYRTLHKIPSDSPSYPGAVSINGTNLWTHERLYDIGFEATPDFSNPRPLSLKVFFVDSNVFFAQIFPVVFLLTVGRTKQFISYTGSIGFVNIMKGIVQLITVLPAANSGEACWKRNFDEKELETVRNTSFLSWGLTQSWGMGHGCNDMLWSGHTAQTVIGFLFIWRTLRRVGLLRYITGVLLAAYLLMYMWSVLVLRMHYSIDIVVAAVVGFFVYTHVGFQTLLWKLANRLACNRSVETPDPLSVSLSIPQVAEMADRSF